MIGRLTAALEGRRFNYDNEADLQTGIAEALREAGISFQRERQLGQDRVDFFLPGKRDPLEVELHAKLCKNLPDTETLLRAQQHGDRALLRRQLEAFIPIPDCPPGIAVEVKVAGSVSAVTRQLLRYAYYPEVTELALVTTKVQHRQVPSLMSGKTVRVIHLGLAVL
jgi:hypothetical protein